MFNWKCFFWKHNFFRKGMRSSQYTTKGYTARVNLMCCINCGKIKGQVLEVSPVTDVYKRWEELAGVSDAVPTPPANTKLTELREILDSSSTLDLSKMNIDVESFKQAERSLSAEQIRVAKLKEKENEGASGS